MRNSLRLLFVPALAVFQFLLSFSSVSAEPDCSAFISQLPAGAIKGYVSVPEDWSDPKGRKINVFYYGSRKAGEERPAVVFFNGGPSSDSHGSYETLRSDIRSEKFDFIFIDQRGTGCSDPYPAGTGFETAGRLANYTSRAIVNDAEEIRKTVLGPDKKWSVFGQSYGGMIVHRYVAVAPKSIEAAYSHGYAVMTDQVEWMKLRILSQSRVAENYFRQYPRDRAALDALRSQIPAGKCFEDEGSRICGPALLDALRHPLGFQDSWEGMHWWIENLAQDSVLNDNMLEGFSRFYVTDFTQSKLASSVINRVEINKGSSDIEECAEAVRRLKKSGDDPDKWPINECRIIAAVENMALDPVIASVDKIDPLRLEDVRSSLEQNPALRLFLYAGQKDTFVPVETFKEEVSSLGVLVEYKLFGSSGHEGYHTEGQVWEDLSAGARGGSRRI
ncbi:MAG: alpha/beta fold hydrolase [Elusimicrobiales bacterium]|nr:alpha/beta fold hydrolase [Elusimicrobiales bacterium]